jgi:hypothetical protein
MIARRLWGSLAAIGVLLAWGCGGDDARSSSDGATGGTGSGGAAATGGARATGGQSGSGSGETGGSDVSNVAVDCVSTGPSCVSVSGTLRGGSPFALSCRDEAASASRLLGDAPAWWVVCRDRDGVTLDLQVPVQELGAVAHTYDATSPTQAFSLTIPGAQNAQTQASPRSENFVSASVAGNVVQREDGLWLMTVTGQGTWTAPTETCTDKWDVACVQAELEVSVSVLVP